MISELAWDSAFFKRKMGELKISHEPFSHIAGALTKAKSEGFHYIIFKTAFRNTRLIRFLESSGFYLSDIGITCSMSTGKLPFTAGTYKGKTSTSVTAAAGKDIPMLKRIIKSLFVESRFYHDPFFSTEEADSLYLAWIENSVKGRAADAVFCVPREGFITCRKISRSGRIVLIGVRRDSRGKGVGTALVQEAMEWFRTQGLRSVSVRTQLRNLDAINFYTKLGFTVKSHDIVFAKIL